MLEFDDQAQGDRPQLVLHVKADVQGSAEAVRDAVEVGRTSSEAPRAQALCLHCAYSLLLHACSNEELLSLRTSHGLT